MKIWITVESFMSFIAMDLLFSFINDAVDAEMKEVHLGALTQNKRKESEMDTERMISDLKSLEVKHRNDKVFTGQLNISEMAHDVRKRLEELKAYEDTGLTPELIRAQGEQIRRVSAEEYLKDKIGSDADGQEHTE